MSWCLADVIEMNGDPGFGPGRADSWDAETPVIFPSIDPTAEGVLIPDMAEPVPAPQNGPGVGPDVLPQPNNRPWIVPPDQVQEAEPFILPPDQWQEGKPFIDRPPPTFPPPTMQPPQDPNLPQNSSSRRQGPMTVQNPPTQGQAPPYPGPVVPAHYQQR